MCRWRERVSDRSLIHRIDSKAWNRFHGFSFDHSFTRAFTRALDGGARPMTPARAVVYPRTIASTSASASRARARGPEARARTWTSNADGRPTRWTRCARARSSSYGEARATWFDEEEDVERYEDARERGDARGRGRREKRWEEDEDDGDGDGVRARRGYSERRRGSKRGGSAYDASANVLKLAYDALVGISEAFTRALDVLLPTAVPMYVIRGLVAGGWCAFAVLSASRLIYGVVVIGSVLCIAVALGNYRDGGGDGSPGLYEFASDSTRQGRRRREDFDERRRASARERKREASKEREEYDYYEEQYWGDASNPTFDNARAFGETFKTAQDVTEEVRQWGEETIDEFKRAFNVNAGEVTFDEDVADVIFTTNTRNDDHAVVVEVDDLSPREGVNVVQIIDVDALNKDSTTNQTESSAQRSSAAEVSFEDWLGKGASDIEDADVYTTSDRRDRPTSDERDSEGASRRDDADAFGDAFRNAFDAFGSSKSENGRNGSARNWLNEFVSGNFYGAFQDDLIPVEWKDDDDDDENPDTPR